MSLEVNLILFVVSCLILVKAASVAVKHVALLATYLRFSEFFAAFAIAGFISVLPELFIGINSALAGNSILGLGTVIGGNVIDLAVIIGLLAVLGKKINFKQRILHNNVFFVLITGLPLVLLIDGSLSQWDGVILIIAFVLYMQHMLKNEKLFVRNRAIPVLNVGKHFIIFLLSMLILFGAAHFVVEYASALALDLMIPAVLIGLFLIAFGTTLPEFSLSLRAMLAKHKELAIGDVMGTVAIDSSFVIGVIALISPTENNFSLLISGGLFMIFAALLIVTFMKNGKQLTRNEGYLLLFLYGMFFLQELLLKGLIH